MGFILCLKYKEEKKIMKNRQDLQNEVTGSGCQEIFSIMVTAVFGCGGAKNENLTHMWCSWGAGLWEGRRQGTFLGHWQGVFSSNRGAPLFPFFSLIITLVPFLFCGKAPWTKVISRRMVFFSLMAPDGKFSMCVGCGTEATVRAERSQLQPHTESRESEIEVGHGYEHLKPTLQWYISSSKYWCPRSSPKTVQLTGDPVFKYVSLWETPQYHWLFHSLIFPEALIWCCNIFFTDRHLCHNGTT